MILPTIKDIIGELQFLTDRISTQVRSIAISLIAITWGLLIGGTYTVFVVDIQLGKKLLRVGILALVVMFCDFMQYFFGYINSNTLRKKLEQQTQKQVGYEYNSWSYRLRGFCFWFKQILLIIVVIYFLVIFFPYLLPK